MKQTETSDLKTKIKLCIVTSTTAAVIVVVWGLTLNLILLYSLQETSPVNTNLEVGNSNGSCSPDVYTGAVCRDALQMYQQCLTNSYNGSGVYIPSDRDQQQVEQQVNQLIGSLKLLSPSPECKEAAVPLICLFYFGLCDSSGELQLPSAAQCETVSRETCAREFQIATAALGSTSSTLLQCEALPTTSVSTSCTRNSTNSSGGGIEITCQVDFYLDGGLCKPECGKWSLYSNELATAINVLVFMSLTVGIISGIAVFILSLIRHKKMFKFPSVFIVYETIEAVLCLLIFWISRTNPKAFHCSSDDLIDSYNNGSPFCTFLGVVYIYVIFQLVVWLLGHVTVLFWGIMFPFHYRTFELSARLKYIHIAIVVVALLLPSIPVGIALGSGGYIYDGIPPLACIPRNIAVAFYATFLPCSILVSLGATFLILILWKLIKERVIRKPKQPVTAHAKVLIITAYLVLINIYFILTLSIRFRLWPDEQLMQELVNYFLCESTGLRPDRTCDRNGIEEYTPSQTLFHIFLILLAMLPAVNLLYAWNYRDVKRTWRNSKLSPHYTTSRHTSSLNRTATELEHIHVQ